MGRAAAHFQAERMPPGGVGRVARGQRVQGFPEMPDLRIKEGWEPCLQP